jgi:large subunit ribosomal protein L34e
MVKPMLRTRARKKVQVKTPGGRTVTHIKEGKPSKRTCGRCGINLAGVPSEVSSVMRNMAKSEKVPSRPYAGVLCSACVERLVTYTTRFEVKSKYPEYAEMELQRDLTIEKYLPKDWYNSVSKK